jgi:hypothetical protein
MRIQILLLSITLIVLFSCKKSNDKSDDSASNDSTNKKQLPVIIDVYKGQTRYNYYSSSTWDSTYSYEISVKTDFNDSVIYFIDSNLFAQSFPINTSKHYTSHTRHTDYTFNIINDSLYASKYNNAIGANDAYYFKGKKQ